MSKLAEQKREEALEKARCMVCKRTDPYVNKTMAAYLCKTLLFAAKEAKTMEIPLKLAKGEKVRRTVTLENAFLTEMVKKYGAHSNYNTMSVLRVFGLLYQSPDWHRAGIYQLTHTGIEFLRGHITVPIEIVYWMDQMEIFWESERRVTFSEAMGMKMVDVKDHLDDWLGRFVKEHADPSGQMSFL